MVNCSRGGEQQAHMKDNFATAPMTLVTTVHNDDKTSMKRPEMNLNYRIRSSKLHDSLPWYIGNNRTSVVTSNYQNTSITRRGTTHTTPPRHKKSLSPKVRNDSEPEVVGPHALPYRRIGSRPDRMSVKTLIYYKHLTALHMRARNVQNDAKTTKICFAITPSAPFPYASVRK